MSRLHGSQVNVQWSVNADLIHLEKKILESYPDWTGGKVKFFSPIKKYNFKEFAGGSFIKGRFFDEPSFWEDLGKTCPEDIRDGSFWPIKGANWDAIAVLTKTNGEKVLLLFEAKAHLGELIHRKDINDWCETSRKIILRSLKETVGKYSYKQADDWLSAYQFSNRIAYAQHLNDCNIETCVIYLLYNNDCSFKDKAISSDENRNWQLKLDKQYELVGVDEDSISSFYHVIELEAPTKEQLRNSGIDIEITAYKF